MERNVVETEKRKTKKENLDVKSTISAKKEVEREDEEKRDSNGRETKRRGAKGETERNG